MAALYLYNTLTRCKEAFIPADAKDVRMYACGPTVYDRAHLGNARSVVVYDTLFRVLRALYGAGAVRYVRNITDVDDKINAAAKAGGEPISALTARVTGWFHEDMQALGALAPTAEPRATAYIPQMIAMIETLVARGHAYASEGHVLFSVASYPSYGALSGRRTEELQAGARVAVESYKRDAGDFVLWKPADAGDDPSSVFDSPWGAGRPGWHIECSAMSGAQFGVSFDLHGGGADLMFPHHENEIAQSCCAHGKEAPLPPQQFARMWVHNGFLTVNGEKMSKSLGNFLTVRDVLAQGVPGEVVRYALLSTHYRSPLDWGAKLVDDARKSLDAMYRALQGAIAPAEGGEDAVRELLDDLNVSRQLTKMHALVKSINAGEGGAPTLRARLKACGEVLGLLSADPEQWFKTDGGEDIEALIAARRDAKRAKHWAEADRIRAELTARGIVLEDRPDGTTDWRRG